MEMRIEVSLQTKQTISQVQMQSLEILTMSMMELQEFLQKEEIENPFSYTVMLCPKEADGKVPLGWEIDKETWHSLRAEAVLIHLPPQAIVLLEDK